MNSGCKLYLGTYSQIDPIDHLIKNCRLKFRCWKYWHFPMFHITSLAILVAYDIYLEIYEGKLDGELKVNYPVDFWTFRDTLSVQMLEYDPRNCKYLGDDARSRECVISNITKNILDKKLPSINNTFSFTIFLHWLANGGETMSLIDHTIVLFF